IPGLACLAHLEREQFEKHSYLLSEVQQKRTEHVVSEVARTKQASAGLRAGRLDAFGAAMTEAHSSLRRLYEVSVPELDALVEAAIAVDGCYGSRLTGAGFGGCSVAILNPGAIEDFAAEVPRRYREATGRDTEVMIFRPAGGPVEWALD
ncbi:MAG: galactokinase, partial [Planctomycetes bacterium]|nr:galactokinase [Planctomycetota bacterium]